MLAGVAELSDARGRDPALEAPAGVTVGLEVDRVAVGLGVADGDAVPAGVGDAGVVAGGEAGPATRPVAACVALAVAVPDPIAVGVAGVSVAAMGVRVPVGLTVAGTGVPAASAPVAPLSWIVRR